jgi:hypothetical protein
MGKYKKTFRDFKSFYLYRHRTVRANLGLVCQCVVECSGFDFFEKMENTDLLKVPKCEIFDNSDFDDFYTIKSLWGGGGGDFWVKIKVCFFYI